MGLGMSAAMSCARVRETGLAAPKQRSKSPVMVLRAGSYDMDLAELIVRGVAECRLAVKGKRVLLKPNLVEFDENTCINTDPRVVAAGVEAFQRLGAAEVLIGEGPGHRRDTWDLAEQAGYLRKIRRFTERFIDLNRDDVIRVQDFVGTHDMYISRAAVQADLIVSMAKMKTHHWSGATLSMKNFFGVVPGSVYGWPKNQLHYLGIEESILGLNKFFRSKSFAIVDGIVGMEGNGPIQGTPKHAGVLVMGNDLAAVDATCCRIMKIDPRKIGYLANCSTGGIDPEWIEQRGAKIAEVKQDFTLIAKFQHLREV